MKRRNKAQIVDLGWRNDLAYIFSSLGGSSLVAAFFVVLASR